MIPKQVFLTKGKGVHANRLHSFELALRDASIETCNLVTVSSIIPSNCNIISRSEGVKELRPGEITFCVLAVHRTKRAGQRIGASIAIAKPEDNEIHGYIAEYHQNNCSSLELKQRAEEIAMQMLVTTSRMINRDERKVWKSKLKDIRNHCTMYSVCEHASKTPSDTWSTVLAAAVFLL